MRAVMLTKQGSPTVLKITDVPLPQLTTGQVQVKIRAIGINYAEILSRKGLYGWAPKLTKHRFGGQRDKRAV